MPKTTLQNDSEVMRWRGAHQTLAGWECTPEQDAIHQDTYARFTAFWATEDRYNVYGADWREL